jgi:hypothetical protein
MPTLFEVKIPIFYSDLLFLALTTTNASNGQEIVNLLNRWAVVLARPLVLTSPTPLHELPVNVVDGRFIRTCRSQATRQRNQNLRIVFVVMIWYLARQYLQQH